MGELGARLAVSDRAGDICSGVLTGRTGDSGECRDADDGRQLPGCPPLVQGLFSVRRCDPPGNVGGYPELASKGVPSLSRFGELAPFQRCGPAVPATQPAPPPGVANSERERSRRLVNGSNAGLGGGGTPGSPPLPSSAFTSVFQSILPLSLLNFAAAASRREDSSSPRRSARKRARSRAGEPKDI